MNPHDDIPEERELTELFDRTAAGPSLVQLTRMSARAVDAVATRSPWRWLAWFGVPTVAAAGLLLVIATSGSAPTEVASGAAPALSVPFELESNEELDDEPFEVATSWSTDTSLDFDDDDDDDGLFESDLGLGMLQPPGDADLDAWLAVTDELLREDG